MATVVLRFYGRFAFADGRNADGTPCRMTVLAPRYDPSRFAPHRVRMWIRRDAVLSNGNGLPNLEPESRMVADGPIERAEFFVWDLSGRTVRVVGKDTAELPRDHRIANIATLETLRQRSATLSPASLTGSTDGPTNAAIQVAGTARTDAAFPGRCDFVRLDKVNTTNPPAVGELTQFADVVEFDIPFIDAGSPDAPARLTLEIKEPNEATFAKKV